MKSIVYQSPVDWAPVFQRHHQLLRAFARSGCRAIFHLPEGVESAYAPGVYELEPNLLLVVGQDPSDLIEGTFVAWCTCLADLEQAGQWQADLTVFDYVDAFSNEFSAMTTNLPELMEAADLLFTVSDPLWQQTRTQHPHAYLLPNGVEFDQFNQAAAPGPVPEELRDLAKPVIGLYGTLSPWIDWDWIGEAADQRSDWSFVVIGPEWQAPKGRWLPTGPNIHLLGRQRYDAMADYLRGFDVAILPFRRTATTLASDPIKLYEYSAAGKPVVAAAIPRAAYVPGIRLATTVEEFIAGIEVALNEPKGAYLEARIDFARQNTWDLRAQRALDLVDQVLAERGTVVAWGAQDDSEEASGGGETNEGV